MESLNPSVYKQNHSTTQGFINFMRGFSSENYGYDAIEASLMCGKAWNRLDRKSQQRFCRMTSEEALLDSCCPKPRKRMRSACPICPRPKPRCRRPKPCCSKPKPRCRKPRPPCCPPKPRCRKPKPPCCAPKPRCRKPKPCCPQKPKRCCPRPKPRCCPRPKPRCPSKPKCCPKPSCKKSKPSCRRSRSPNCGMKYKCQKPGPRMNNAFLNFLRVFRKKNCGLSPQELVTKAARAWCNLSEDEKDRYRRQACRVSSNPRVKRRKVCQPRCAMM